MTDIQQVESRTEEELVMQAQAGSRSSFESLMERYRTRLYYYLRQKSLSDPEVEDLLQDTFIRVFENLHRYDRTYKFSTWVYTIANHLAVSSLRKRRVRENAVSVLAAAEKPVDTPERVFERDNLWAIARHLKPAYYRILWLRYAEDLSIQEISRVLEKSAMNVRVLLHRARIHLSEMIHSEVGADALEKARMGKRGFSMAK